MLNDAHQAIIGWMETLAGMTGAPKTHWGPSGPPNPYPNIPYPNIPYPNIGVVPCGSSGDGPPQPRALKWAENTTDGTLRDTQWHEVLTISCAQAAGSSKIHSCGHMVMDEHIAMSRITHSPNVTRWNDTENLQWAVAGGFVREARGKCLSVVGAETDGGGRRSGGIDGVW